MIFRAFIKILSGCSLRESSVIDLPNPPMFFMFDPFSSRLILLRGGLLNQLVTTNDSPGVFVIPMCFYSLEQHQLSSWKLDV